MRIRGGVASQPQHAAAAAAAPTPAPGSHAAREPGPQPHHPPRRSLRGSWVRVGVCQRAACQAHDRQRARETCAGVRLLWRRRRSLAASAPPLPLRPTSRSSAHLGPDLHVDGGAGGRLQEHIAPHVHRSMCTAAAAVASHCVPPHPPRRAVPAGLPGADDGHLPPTIHFTTTYLLPTHKPAGLPGADDDEEEQEGLPLDRRTLPARRHLPRGR